MDTLYAIWGGVKTKTNHQNNGYIQSLFEGNPASENYESGDATLQALRVCWLYNIIFPSTCLWCVHALQPNVKPTISLLALAISNGRGGEGLSTTERGAYTCRIFVKLFRAGFTAITISYVLPYMFPYIAAADATDTTRARCNILANLGKLSKPLETVVKTVRKQMKTVKTVTSVVQGPPP